MSTKEILTSILERKDTRIHYFPSGKEFTVDQLRADAERLCAQTQSVSSIFLCAPNSYEWLVVYFACALSEKTLYTADFQLTDTEIERRIAACKPDMIIVSGRRLEQKTVSISDILFYSNQQEVSDCVARVSCGNYNFVQFTSGTTGISKGVVMHYEQITSNLVCMQELCKFEQEDRFLLASPMSHPMGHIFMLLTLAYSDRLLLVESPMFLPQAIMTSGASIMVTPPVMLTSLRAHAEIVERLASFRYLLVVGAPLDEVTYAFYKNKNVRIMNGYGMTECVSGVAIGEPDSTGRLIPLSCCEIRIADDGEILVRGGCVCNTYLNGDSITKDGWYHTKDLGEFRDGKLVVTGRKDNLVVLQNGYKIALEPMESKINSVSGVLDSLVRVLRENGRDVIECDVVLSKDCALSPDELKKRINEKLDFYEKVERLNVCEKLALNGGKKARKK